MAENSRTRKALSLRMIASIILIFVFCSLQFLFLRLSQIEMKVALFDVAVLFLLSALFTKAIATIQRYYHSGEVLNITNLGTIVLFGLITALGSHILSINLFRNYEKYISFLDYTALVRGLIIILIYTILMIIFWMEQQQKQALKLQQFAVEKEREKNQMELMSLQQQLKPHFLFNSLNSIYALLQKDKDEAGQMLITLSEFMRSSLRTSGELISVSDELDLIQKYLKIEEVRFGDRLKVHVQLNEEAAQLRIPSFLLQPLIENAIKHGLYNSLGDVQIVIVASKNRAGDLELVITNPFDESSGKETKGTGFGLQSVRKKLLIIYGASGLLETERKDGTFRVNLKIPQHEKSTDNR